MSETRITDTQSAPATITPGRDICTMINTLTVKPEKQQEVLDYLRHMTEEAVVQAPGFISANFHPSKDGTKVINYAQWRSLEDLQAMLNSNPEHVKHILSLVEQIDTRTDLTVAYCAHPR